jgi:hypothetical protein
MHILHVRSNTFGVFGRQIHINKTYYKVAFKMSVLQWQSLEGYWVGNMQQDAQAGVYWGQ